jgi:predicted nucleic acid-binding protein
LRGWLLDTNVLSELRRPRPDAQVVAFVAAQPVPSLYVSTATMAEIRFGIELIADFARRTDLNAWLTHTLRPLFEGRVVPITEDVLVRWRQLVDAGRKRGHTYGGCASASPPGRPDPVPATMRPRRCALGLTWPRSFPKPDW